LQVSYNGSFNVVTNSKVVDVFSADEYRTFVDNTYPAGNTLGDFLRERMGTANTDWQSQIFRTAISHDNNLSLYGNYNEKLPYRVSLGFTGEQGTLQTSKSDRYTADMSLSPKLLDNHLTITANAKGIYSKEKYGDGGAVNAAAFFDPTQDIYFRNTDGSIDYTTTNGYWNWLNNGRGDDVSPNVLAPVSPLSMLYDRDNNSTAKRFIGNMQVDYKIHGFEDLRLNVNAGMDISEGRGSDGDVIGSIQAYKNTEDRGYGQTSKGYNFKRNQLLEMYANYNKEFGIHHIDAMAGYSWQHVFSSNRTVVYRNSNNSQIGEDYNYPLFRTEYYLLSFYGRMNYTLNNKYLFTATLRDDASSRFSKDNRWGLFPSAAFAWNIKKENFLKDTDYLNSLKFRLSWGVTGQQEIGTGDYPYLARYVLSTDQYTQYYMGNAGYLYKLTPLAYDPNIKWESTTTYNAGIDYGFLDDRISGSVDVYYRETKDLINQVFVPLGSNFSNTLLTNVGNMVNKGVELAFNFIPIRKSDMSLNIGLNGTFQKIEFTKLTKTDDPNYGVQVGSISKGTGGFLQYHKVGYAPYTYYLYQQVYDANGKPIQNAVVDRDGDGVITSGDRYMTNKSPNPDFFYGVNLKFNYKNWDFGLNGHGSVGNWLFNDFYSANSTSMLPMASGNTSNYSKVVLKSGFKETNSNEQNYSDMFLENASFFRLDDINAGYTFKNINDRGSNIRVAVGATNLFVLTKYSGLDPEAANVNGVDYNIWPRPRVFSLRLNVNF
jgi:TonB-linked outer membrane protein, SusC/RagA family